MIRLGLPKGRMASDSDRFCGALGVQIEAGVLSYKTMAGSLQISVHRSARLGSPVPSMI